MSLVSAVLAWLTFEARYFPRARASETPAEAVLTDCLVALGAMPRRFRNVTSEQAVFLAIPGKVARRNLPNLAEKIWLRWFCRRMRVGRVCIATEKEVFLKMYFFIFYK